MAQARARYDEFAGWYEQWIGDAPPLIAAQAGLLPAVTGERVLDIACEQGRMSRYLARLGAQVVGVDISTAMLGKARAIGPASSGSDVPAVAVPAPLIASLAFGPPDPPPPRAARSRSRSGRGRRSHEPAAAVFGPRCVAGRGSARSSLPDVHDCERERRGSTAPGARR